MPKTTHELKPYYLDPNKIEIGLDEAGKGSYFSRVYAGAVVWDPEITSPLIRDSKELGSHRKRMEAYDFIKEHAPAWGVGWAEVEEIDRMNINKANIQAMYRAIKNTNIMPEHLVLDGKKEQFKGFLYLNQDRESVSFSTIEKGDTLYYSVAAASIVAKVERDLYMEKLCDTYPYLDLYDIRNNKGYGAAKHEEAMAHWGVTKFHRMSYAPCKRYGDKVNLGE